MASILLRFTRRRTAWEPGIASEDLFDSEFRLRDGTADLRPSVYDIEDCATTIVKVHAEHAAGIGNNPQGGTNLDLSGWGNTVISDGTSSFRFAQGTHRELLFANRSTLIDFLDVVCAQIESRSRPTKGRELVDYAKSRIGLNDDEWAGFCRETGQSKPSKARKWGCSTVR